MRSPIREGALIVGKSVLFQQCATRSPPQWPDPAHPQPAHSDDKARGRVVAGSDGGDGALALALRGLHVADFCVVFRHRVALVTRSVDCWRLTVQGLRMERAGPDDRFAAGYHAAVNRPCGAS
jgi:hypothetical protein